MVTTSKDERSILIVEDDEGLQSQLRWTFDDYTTAFASDRQSAVAMIRKLMPAVVTLDLGLPPDPTNASEGMKALDEILSFSPKTKVIVVTGNEDRDNAIQAVAKGAYDFYQKPIDPDVLKIIVERAFHVCSLEQENQRLIEIQSNNPLDGILAASPEMLSVCRSIEKVAPADVTVLLLGDSGTGKELLAKALHNYSARKTGPFIAINCAAIPENLLESELFGYEKGAYTGAVKQTLGKIELAEGGTLFLDEIGDLPLALQAKLLRFVQERVIERVGGRKEIPVDVRMVCATHRDIPEMVKLGEFREDLFYRLSEISIEIPSLSKRTGDAVLLARNFVEKYAKKHNSKVKGFSNEAIKAIDSYVWPGNVRELENKVKRAVIMAESSLLTVEDLGVELDEDNNVKQPMNLRQARDQAEHTAIVRAMSFTGNNIAQAAELLGVSRPTLYDLLAKFNLKS